MHSQTSKNKQQAKKARKRSWAGAASKVVSGGPIFLNMVPNRFCVEKRLPVQNSIQLRTVAQKQQQQHTTKSSIKESGLTRPGGLGSPCAFDFSLVDRHVGVIDRSMDGSIDLLVARTDPSRSPQPAHVHTRSKKNNTHTIASHQPSTSTIRRTPCVAFSSFLLSVSFVSPLHNTRIHFLSVCLSVIVLASPPQISFSRPWWAPAPPAPRPDALCGAVYVCGS